MYKSNFDGFGRAGLKFSILLLFTSGVAEAGSNNFLFSSKWELKRQSWEINSPQPVLARHFPRHKNSNHKKATAALLAFPLPFGIVGLHRVYLGTAPYVPLIYIATVGGCFGILPLIDFVVIIATKDLDTYSAQPGIFMWNQ